MSKTDAEDQELIKKINEAAESYGKPCEHGTEPGVLCKGCFLKLRDTICNGPGYTLPKEFK
jgi:hypothetical protein